MTKYQWGWPLAGLLSVFFSGLVLSQLAWGKSMEMAAGAFPNQALLSGSRTNEWRAVAEVMIASKSLFEGLQSLLVGLGVFIFLVLLGWSLARILVAVVPNKIITGDPIHAENIL